MGGGSGTTGSSQQAQQHKICNTVPRSDSDEIAGTSTPEAKDRAAGELFSEEERDARCSPVVDGSMGIRRHSSLHNWQGPVQAVPAMCYGLPAANSGSHKAQQLHSAPPATGNQHASSTKHGTSMSTANQRSFPSACKLHGHRRKPSSEQRQIDQDAQWGAAPAVLGPPQQQPLFPTASRPPGLQQAQQQGQEGDHCVHGAADAGQSTPWGERPQSPMPWCSTSSSSSSNSSTSSSQAVLPCQTAVSSTQHPRQHQYGPPSGQNRLSGSSSGQASSNKSISASLRLKPLVLPDEDDLLAAPDSRTHNQAVPASTAAMQQRQQLQVLKAAGAHISSNRIAPANSVVRSSSNSSSGSSNDVNGGGSFGRSAGSGGSPALQLSSKATSPCHLAVVSASPMDHGSSPSQQGYNPAFSSPSGPSSNRSNGSASHTGSGAPHISCSNSTSKTGWAHAPPPPPPPPPRRQQQQQVVVPSQDIRKAPGTLVSAGVGSSRPAAFSPSAKGSAQQQQLQDGAACSPGAAGRQILASRASSSEAGCQHAQIPLSPTPSPGPAHTRHPPPGRGGSVGSGSWGGQPLTSPRALQQQHQLPGTQHCAVHPVMQQQQPGVDLHGGPPGVGGAPRGQVLSRLQPSAGCSTSSGGSSVARAPVPADSPAPRMQQGSVRRGDSQLHAQQHGPQATVGQSHGQHQHQQARGAAPVLGSQAGMGADLLAISTSRSDKDICLKAQQQQNSTSSSQDVLGLQPQPQSCRKPHHMPPPADSVPPEPPVRTAAGAHTPPGCQLPVEHHTGPPPSAAGPGPSSKPVVLASCLPEDEDDLLGITPSPNVNSNQCGHHSRDQGQYVGNSSTGSTALRQQHMPLNGGQQQQQPGVMAPPPPPPPKCRRSSEAAGQSAGVDAARMGRSLSSPGEPPLYSPPAHDDRHLGLAGVSASNICDPHLGMRSPVGVPASSWPAGVPRRRLTIGPPSEGHRGHMPDPPGSGTGPMGRPGPPPHGMLSPTLTSPASGPVPGVPHAALRVGPMGVHSALHGPMSHGPVHASYPLHPAVALLSQGGGQQLLPPVKPPPSKRLEIVDPRLKVSDTPLSSSSSSLAAADVSRGIAHQDCDRNPGLGHGRSGAGGISRNTANRTAVLEV